MPGAEPQIECFNIGFGRVEPHLGFVRLNLIGIIINMN